MEFAETSLKGAYLVRLKKMKDDRGYFARAWCCDEFSRQGLNPGMLQLNVGFSHSRGTVRGMHYQLPPHAEVKFIRCTRGAIWDVIIDLREGSPTVGRWYGIELTPDNGLMLYAPEGFAHGYQTLQDDTEMYYLTSAHYAPAAARGVRYDDPTFGVIWPMPVSLISVADRQWPDFPVKRFVC
jgi:dTDP-4-dehydrorhamnose 3,5-epimerase